MVRSVISLLFLFLFSALTVHGREILQEKEVTSSTGTPSAESCSFASAKATYGKATSHASANSLAIAAAGKECAKAAVDALSASCSGKNVIAAIQTAAAACAAVYAKVYVKTIGFAQSSGRSKACAQACANAYGYAKSTAEAIAAEYDGEKDHCSEVSALLKAEAFTKALTDAYAKSFSKACAESRMGKATAATVAEGWLTVSATAIAKALGTVVATSCTKCSGCKCQGGVQYEAESKTDVYSEVVGGTYALTKAIADAGAIFCEHKGKHSAEISKTAIHTYLKAYADICIKVYGKLYAKAATAGEYTFACSGVFGSFTAVSEALSEVVAKAWANNYHGFCPDVFSYVEGSVLVKDAAKVVGEASIHICSHNSSPTTISSTDIYKYITQYQPYSEALQQAYSTATTKCPCPSPYLCCSTCDLTQTCPAYKDE